MDGGQLLDGPPQLRPRRSTPGEGLLSGWRGPSWDNVVVLEGRPLVATVQEVLASGGGPGLKAESGGDTVVTEETRQDQPSALGAKGHIS